MSSWAPSYVSDGRGGFIRRTDSEGEEGEASPDPPAAATTGLATPSRLHLQTDMSKDEEEEGEISTPTEVSNANRAATASNLPPPLDMRDGPPLPRFARGTSGPTRQSSFGPPPRHMSRGSNDFGPNNNSNSAPPQGNSSFNRESSFPRVPSGSGPPGGGGFRGFDRDRSADFRGDFRGNPNNAGSNSSTNGGINTNNNAPPPSFRNQDPPNFRDPNYRPSFRDNPPRDGPPFRGDRRPGGGPPFNNTRDMKRDSNFREGMNNNRPPPFRREGSFRDLGHPREPPFESAPRPPFREDGPQPPIRNPPPPVNAPSSFPPPAGPSDPRRPTDPRRRSVPDLTASSLQQSQPQPPPRVDDGPPRNMPPHSPPSKRRIGSYSSLADSSSIPSSLMPSQPSHETGGGPFRRRSSVELPGGPRNDRAPDSFSGSRPVWSPNERRPPSSSPRNIPVVHGYGNNNTSNNAPIPPLAPTLSNRPFRDPRLNQPPPVNAGGSLDVPIKKKTLEAPKSEPGTLLRRDSERSLNSRGSPNKPKPTKSETMELKLPKPLPPLRTTSLGQEQVVQRAEEAVAHLSDVVGDPDLKATGDDVSQLPPKQVIVSAVTQIEGLIKQAQRDLDTAVEEKKEAELAEEEAKKLEEKRRLEEEEEKARELERAKVESRRIEEEEKETELEKALEECHEEIDKIRQGMEKELEEELAKATQDEQHHADEALEAEVTHSEVAHDKDITKARNSIEKARANASKLEAEIADMESEFEALAKTPAVEEPVSNSQEPRFSMPSLVDEIVASNKRKANESQMLAISFFVDSEQAHAERLLSDMPEGPTDPKYGKTLEEWSEMSKQVTGLADALYSEPTESPYYDHNERTNSILAPIIKEYVRDKQERLRKEGTVLAEEYEVRRRLYEKQQRKLAKKASRGSVSFKRYAKVFAENTESTSNQGTDRDNVLESGGRSSNNPYRRARRGNEVRSEYEQEQIIAEIAAKEAMEKRITHGGCKCPRQVSKTERGLTASYVSKFTAHLIDDPLQEAKDAEVCSVWTDMEKSIFLDRFLQFPKDFRRIASFLRNKTAKDCVGFYYDSKQTIPFKGALKEHMMRRKRKGDYQIWDATIQAALSVGSKVTAGTGEDKPVEFTLPDNDRTYRTYMLHPLRRAALDAMEVDEKAAKEAEELGITEDSKWKSRKRGRDPLFFLEKEHTKYLRVASQESMSLSVRKPVPPVEEEEEEEKKPEPEEPSPAQDATPSTPVRKAPQKWTPSEKKIFVETLEKYGRDWKKLAEAVGNKSDKQIKNFYYDWKKGKSRTPIEKKEGRREKTSKSEKKAAESQEDVDMAEQAGAEMDVESAPHVSTPKDQDEEVEAPPPKEETVQSARTTQVESGNPSHEASDNASSEADNDYNSANRQLIQQILNQQRQQQQLEQQSQSAIQQLLSQQQLQREREREQSLEEARRLLEQQSQRDSALSSLLNPAWLAASQLLQSQGSLQAHSVASALRGDGGSLGGLSDLSDLQRLIQLQQASQNLGLASNANPLSALLLGSGLSGGTGSGLSAALLSQLESLASGAGAAPPEPAPAPAESLPNMANIQALLASYGASNSGLANALYQQPPQPQQAAGALDSVSVSDALSLLARSLQQQRDAGNNGFGR